MKRKSIKTRIAAIVAHWKDRDEDLGFSTLIADAGASRPCCMICGLEPGRIATMLLNEPERTWAKSGLERAHLHSVEFGGADEPSNLLMACRQCNRMMPQFDTREAALRHLASARWVGRARWAEARARYALSNDESIRSEVRGILRASKEDFAEVAAARQHA